MGYVSNCVIPTKNMHFNVGWRDGYWMRFSDHFVNAPQKKTRDVHPKPNPYVSWGSGELDGAIYKERRCGKSVWVGSFGVVWAAKHGWGLTRGSNPKGNDWEETWWPYILECERNHSQAMTEKLCLGGIPVKASISGGGASQRISWDILCIS